MAGEPLAAGEKISVSPACWGEAERRPVNPVQKYKIDSIPMEFHTSGRLWLKGSQSDQSEKLFKKRISNRRISNFECRRVESLRSVYKKNIDLVHFRHLNIFNIIDRIPSFDIRHSAVRYSIFAF